MKSAELIRRLQEADPTGELEVTVGKTDIFFVECMPGYYDGHYQVLVRDPALEGECYNIVGAEIRGNGRHLCLNTHSIRDMLADEPELPVTYDSKGAEEYNAKHVEEWREFGRKMLKEYPR